MDFLQNAVHPFEQLGAIDIANPARELAAQVTGNKQAYQNAAQVQSKNLQPKTFASNIAQIGLDVAAPGIAKGAEAAVGLGDTTASTIGGKIALGAAKGAVSGAAIGGPTGVAQGIGQDNGNSLALDFIHGVEQGAVTGGAIGGAAPAVGAGMSTATDAFRNRIPLNNEVGAIGPGTGDLIDDKTANSLAKSDNQKDIQKQLKESVGPVVANDVAPAVASATDPNVVKNIVTNDVNNKVAPAIPPPTPTSDINTPQQVQGMAQSEEESLFQQEQQQPSTSFMAGPSETPTGPTHVGNLAATTGMHDILNSGGTTDEALSHYMNTTGASYGEAQNALDELIQGAGNGGSLDRSKINAKLNPQYENVEFPGAGSKDAAILNGQYAGNKVVDAGRTALNEMQQLSEHDQELMRSLKGRDPEVVINAAENPEQFAKAVSALKDYNDYTQAAGAKLGQDIPYRQNYGLRTPYTRPEDVAAGTSTAALPENASYTKARQYQTHEEALANKETPKYASALEDLQNDISQRSHDQSQLALAKGLEETYPGQVKIINNGQIPSGYRQLLIPNGDKIFMPNDIAGQINERQMAKSATGTLGKYDQLNAAGKNLELGGGLFHGANTGGIFVGQQLASGKLFSNPSAAGDVVKNLFSPKATSEYISNINKEGTFDENHSIVNAADATGLSYSHVASDIGSPSDKGLVGKISSIPGIKQIHEAIFERQIPTMMLETFRQKTQGLDIFGNAADREQGIKIAKAINNEYGHLNRDIQGMTPKQFKLASRVMLAADYQEGQIRTLGNAFNPKNIGTADGKLAREAVFGKALLFGGLSALGAAAGGDFKGDSPKQTALAIMNKAINPSFNIAGYQVGLPATQISNVAKPIEQSVASAKKGQGVASGLENFASSHAAFLPSKAEEFGTNKNFQGNAVYGHDYFGRPISPGTVAANVVSGVLPVPLAQTAQTATGGESVGAAVANTAGLNVHPQYSLNYAPIAGQTYVQRLEATPGVSKEKIQAATEFFDLLGAAVKGKNKTITAAETAIKAGDPQKANQVIATYNQNLAKTLQPWEKQGNSQYFDGTMGQLLQSAVLNYSKANKQVNYVTKTNPTSIGAPIQSLTSKP